MKNLLDGYQSMTDYILEGKIIKPLTENNPKQIIVLCHGYGGDGQDISMLAINWQRFLPEAIFFCPNAPQICSVNPNGFQWFDLSKEYDDKILENSIIAEEKLNLYLEQILNNYNLESQKLALVGFSQGCMISVQAALKNKQKLNCVIGYSGKVINQKHLSDNIKSKPKIFLMHGDNDTIVPAMHLLEAKEYLSKCGIKIKTKLFKNCEHRIPVEGVSFGLDFLRKNLL